MGIAMLASSGPSRPAIETIRDEYPAPIRRSLTHYNRLCSLPRHRAKGSPIPVNNASDKVALVTGSGKRRIGWYVADALAARGYSLVIHYRRSAAEATDTLD